MFLENIPNTDFELVESTRRLDDEMAVEGVPLSSNVEGVVKVCFTLGGSFLSMLTSLLSVKAMLGSSSCILARRREIKWGAFLALAETSRQRTVG
jgi:hypothetical protein